MSDIQHPAVAALLSLEERLTLIFNLCGSGIPKQTVGEQIAAMRRMPEWDIVRMALPATLGAGADESEKVTSEIDVAVESDTGEVSQDVVEAFTTFYRQMRKERGGGPGAMPFTPLQAFAAGVQARGAFPVQIGHIPPGWTIARDDQPPFKHIRIEAPNGALSRVSNVSRAPENILYMLTDALLSTQPDEPEEPAAEERCARCQGGRNLASGKCPAGQPDCATYPGWNTTAALDAEGIAK